VGFNINRLFKLSYIRTNSRPSRNLFLFSVLVALFFVLIPNIVNAQIDITFKEVFFFDENSIAAKVFARNYGSTINIWSYYGYPYTTMRIDNKRIHFFISYKDESSNRQIILIPSSITIKTILGSSIPMDLPIYEFRTTGLNTGELWEILFIGIPDDASNVNVSVLSAQYSMGDMPRAYQARIERQIKVDSLLLSGNQYFQNKEYKDAITKYTAAIQFDNALLDEYSPKVAQGFTFLALESYQNNDFPQAIEYFNLAINADSTVKAPNKSQLAKSHFKLAQRQLSGHQYDSASENFRKATFIDKDIISEVENLFQKIRRNSTITTLFSIIPGGGQVRNRQYTEGVLHFGIFVGFSALSYNYFIKAENYYEDYQKAETGAAASFLYDDTEEAWNSCLVYGGFALATIIWSMVNANSVANDFNSKFAVSERIKGLSLRPNCRNNQITLTMEMRF